MTQRYYYRYDNDERDVPFQIIDVQQGVDYPMASTGFDWLP
jgi:hypothetical protein